VDVENTRINAALIVKQSVGGAANGFTTPCSQWYDVAPENGERLYDTDFNRDTVPTSSVYASEFVGLECLTEIPLTLHRAQYCPTSNSRNGTGQFRSTDTVFVRLVMDVRFKPNEYGVRNRSLVIYTLPVNLVSKDDTLTSSGMPTYDGSCGKPRIAPYSGDINAFCTSSQYKAKELADAVIAGDEHSDPFENWSKDHRLRARLETGQQQLVVVSESTEDPMVVVQVYDVIGNLVATGQGYESAEPLTRTTVPMNGVPAGAYVVIATSGGRSATFKILYAP
jgi:hypothetical protein